jgi:hypothetical protein
MLMFLTLLSLVAMIVEFIIVAAVILLVIDAIFFGRKESRKEDRRTPGAKTKQSVTDMLCKEQLRREKEAAAHEGFFEESYVRGFDPTGALYPRVVKIPTEKALEYYREMDQLTGIAEANNDIFRNIEEL